MNPVQPLVSDPARVPERATRAGRRYTVSFTDGLGDRLLTFDNTTGMSLELLRFKKEFSDSPAFEKALRERVDHLLHFRHPSVATVRAVERLEDGEGLVVVSKLTPGRRLSDLLPKARGPVFALELIRQVTPALAALQQSGHDTTHGALNAERIVVAREGRLVLVDHLMGSAIEALRLPVARLRAELGLVLQVGTDATRLDARSDIIQLGFVALSLLLGRSLNPADYPGQVGTLLDEFTKAESGKSAGALRQWLERALQVGVRPFSSAKDAQDALAELPEEDDAQAEPNRTLLAFRSSESGGEPPAEAGPVAVKKPDVKPLLQEAVKPAAVAKTAPTPPSAPAKPAAPAAAAARKVRRFETRDWVLAGVSAIAVVEALAVAALLYARAETVTVDVRSPRAEFLERGIGLAPVVRIEAPAATPVTSDASAAAAAAQRAAAEAHPPAPAPEPPPVDRAAPGPRFGGVRVASAIDLQVYEAGRLLGSTAGPIAVNEGLHEFELVNEALGFRMRQSVTVRAGQLAPMTVVVPNGRISINAVPWAEVIIDGNAAGQTPLANLSLPIGSHEIVFRHPQFPEQRQTVLVKAEGLTRVSATLQR
jgi:hypothetical protein